MHQPLWKEIIPSLVLFHKCWFIWYMQVNNLFWHAAKMSTLNNGKLNGSCMYLRGQCTCTTHEILYHKKTHDVPELVTFNDSRICSQVYVYICVWNLICPRKQCNNILLQEWWNSCEKGNLLPALKKHWRIFVLSVFGNNHDPGKEERLAHKFLFRPMEYFLCRQDPEVVFEELKAKNMPSQLCGKVFKTGEPTYSCR